MYNNEIAIFKIKNIIRAWLDVDIIPAISFQGFSVLPVPWKKRDPGYKVGPTKVTAKRATKACNLFYNIAAKRIKSQTCLATNQVLAGCTNVLQKVQSSSTFCNKTCTSCAFYRPKEDLSCRKWRNTRVWRDSRLILSHHKSVFTQFATSWFVVRQVWFVSG